MSNGDPALIEFISSHIRRDGPVTFRWFMEQALYHPSHGYYASGKAAIGRHGDYFTNVSVGPLFGKLLAAQFREMWERMERPARFTIVEQGANNGDFARDVLAAARLNFPGFFEVLRYAIVEPFPVLRARQEEALKSFSQTEWHANLADMEPFQGVHFSNELVDAMPVHLVKFHDGEWKELYAGWHDGAFRFVEGPLSSPKLQTRVQELNLPRIENYTTEINLGALDWIQSLASRLKVGYALIVDYGWPRDVHYCPDRTSGTLACYSQHKWGFDPLQNVGASDITAHVEFTSLAESAVASGFRLAGFADQHHFMVGLGKNEFPDTDVARNTDRQKALRAFQTLMHPGFMGLGFKFLALEKGLSAQPGPTLAGFQYSGNPASAGAVLGMRI